MNFYMFLSGILIINNPENGETHKVNAGESVFFRKDTWHHGFNYSDNYLQVLEFFFTTSNNWHIRFIRLKKKKLLDKSIYKRDDISLHDNDFKNENTFKIIKKR